MVIATAHLDTATLAEVRDLMDAAFDDFTDLDWSHGLGGLHALVRVGGPGAQVVAHGALVQRRLLVEGRSLRCGYVEAMATHPDHRRRGHATTVLAELESLAPGYDLLALSTSQAGLPLYLGRGWQPWRGPTGVVAPSGVRPTPDDDGGVLVLGGTGLDLDAGIACEWRDGEVW